MPFEFRCKRCGEVKDVRVLRDSVCPECRERAENLSSEAASAAALQRAAYDAKLARGPHYTGPLESWAPGDPVLLPDGLHFVCPRCRRKAHLVHDLAHRWNKNAYPVPTKSTVCDACKRRETEEPERDTGLRRNRFNRER